MGQFLSSATAADESGSQSTPKNIRMTVDPRSPTAEFDRTPVKVESTPQCGKGGVASAAGGDSGENVQQLQRGLDTTPNTTRERPRSLHQKLVAEKHKKMSVEEQLKLETTPTTSH